MPVQLVIEADDVAPQKLRWDEGTRKQFNLEDHEVAALEQDKSVWRGTTVFYLEDVEPDE